MAIDEPNNAADVTELVMFTDYTSNAGEDAALKTVIGLDGCSKVYHGSQIEENVNGLWVQEWESLAHHTAFQNSDIFPSFLAGVPAFAKTVARIINVPLKPYPATEVFGAPVTEVCIATLKPETQREDFEKIIGMMHQGVSVTPGAIASAHGIALENDRQYIYVCGWESIESHHEALAPDYAQEILKQIHAMAEFDVRHYKLSQ